MPERVTVTVGGIELRGWGDFQLTRHLDSYASASFAAPFDASDARARATFRPLSFLGLDVAVDGVPVLTGTMVDVEPQITAAARSVGVSAYARPGVLADAVMPSEAWPLELNGLTLRQVAERVGASFDLGVRIDDDTRATFRRVAFEPDDRPHEVLAELARQRGLVISDTRNGKIWLRKPSSSGTVVARLVEGAPPAVSQAVSFAAREYGSEVIGIGSGRAGAAGQRYVATNPRLQSVTRPLVYRPEDTEAGDVPAATRARLARMFAAAASYEIGVATWRDASGALWEPGALVELDAPSLMVYRPTALMIRSVRYSLTAGQTSAVLSLVFPGAFAGEPPEVFPWD